MVDKLIEILKACHEKWPTEKAKHNFTYDVEEDKPYLNIIYNNKWYQFHPEGNDFHDLNEDLEIMNDWILKLS